MSQPASSTNESDAVSPSGWATWVRSLLLRRSTAALLSGLVVTGAAITLCHPTSMMAGQDAGSDDGLMIMPRGSDVTTAPLPGWRAAAVPAPSTAQPQRPHTPHKASLQAPRFASSAASNSVSSASAAGTTSAGSPAGHSILGPPPAGIFRPAGVGVFPPLPNASNLNAPRSQDAPTTSVPPVPAVPGSGVPEPIPAVPGAAINAHELPSNGDRAVPLINEVPPLSSPPVVQSPAGHSLRQDRIAAPAPGTSGFRATVEADAPGWIGPYMGRTDLLPSGSEQSPTPAPSVQLPRDFTAWWDPLVKQQAGLAPAGLPVDVTSLVQQALVHSPKVQVLQADPEVQLRVVKQEEAVFDWRAFLDTKYDDLNDPVGNTLTTGNNDTRFVDNKTNGAAGLKRKTTTGGEFRVSQQLGHEYNNSRFLLPNPQTTSRLELSFRQPLMNHAGVQYNQNQIVLARINANMTSDESLEELQSHLFSVAEAYWKLYRARAEFFQRQKLLSSAQKVLTTLEGRNQVDTIPRQILRARAAVARAESRMQRAVTDIRNAESQLRLLVNDPEMLNNGPVEFMPTETPAIMPSPVGLRESLQSALVNRPDISEAIREMRAAGVRMGVSKNEMLPKLDFIVTSYVAGLQNNAQIIDSITDQYSLARPGYTVGLEFEVPLGNRMAKAKLEQRQWELKRAINGFRTTVETSLTEVEISSREVETAWRELLGKYSAMLAAQNEVSYLQDRFNVLPMVEESSMLLLEDLLDGYERLADEESAFAQAEANYALSIIQLRRATGTLMRSRHDAPELQADETEWMQTRADIAATDAEARSGVARNAAKSVTPSKPSDNRVVPAGNTKGTQSAPIRSASGSRALVPNEPSAADAEDPKAEWAQPVGRRPSESAEPLIPSRSRPKTGHSFGQSTR